MISFKHKGNFKKTDKLLTGALKINVLNILHKYAKQGIIALSTATPKDTGITANSWDYIIKLKDHGYSISWTNSNTVNGIPVVILLQYGHGTGTGGYVEGRDFINPAIKPVMDKIADDIFEEVKKL
jgi:hypothetical protein